MRGSGPEGPHRGERARIAARVRTLLAPGPAASRPPAGGVPSGGGPRLRWEPDRRAVSVIAAAVLVAGLLTAWWVFSARPRQLAVRSAAAAGTGQAAPGQPRGSAAGAAQVAPGDAPGATSGGGAAASGSAATLVVDVAGKVRRPGVYELTSGARVVDALRAAGGAKPGVSTTALNLAAPLQDGEQVLVGVRGAAPAAGAGTAGGSAGSAGPVALNSATLEQLEALPGIGPVLAQHILDWRSQHGSFTSVQQLNEVSGIGPAKFAQLRDLVTP